MVMHKKTAFFPAVFFSITVLLAAGVSGQELESLDRELSRIIDRISPAVVTVEARPQAARPPLFPGKSAGMSEAVSAVVGSGLIIDSLGHILTVLGLVEGYDNFSVKLDSVTMPAKLVGVDQRYNLALLKIDSAFYNYPDISPIPPLSGRLALAYGRAIGSTGYPALGIIAGQCSDGTYLISGSVQPGLVGGGVFDLSGRLIGIISSGSITGPQAGENLWGGIVMFPASIAITAADRIIQYGNREAGYLGIRASAIEIISGTGEILDEAVVVSGVDPRSPAAAAGLRVGDIITHFAQQKVRDERELQRLIGISGFDNPVDIKFIRGRRNFAVQVPLSATPAYHGVITVPPAPNESRSGRPDVVAADLQRRIDILRAEMRRIQQELDILMTQLGLAR